ncbi:MAG TPA: sugar phosphate isomerase/epimerase family protein [Selenomonadales bacterium]|nr:sugar phosphate isomerase/epimerase family protein [Selenomonadales bacterium]
MKYLLSAVTWDEFLRSGMCQLELVPLADKYDCAGIEFRPYWRRAMEELPAIREFLAEYELISAYACDESLLGQSEESARQSLRAVDRSLTFAGFLGSAVLQVNIANEPFSPALVQAQWWQEEIRRLIAKAREKEILLAVQNIPYGWSGDPVFLRDLVELFDSPWLRVSFAAGNWLAAGWEPGEALDVLKGYLGYVHIQDISGSQGSYRSCPPGTGLVDVGGLIGRLRQAGYQGYCALALPGGKSPAASVKAGLQLLQQEIE